MVIETAEDKPQAQEKAGTEVVSFRLTPAQVQELDKIAVLIGPRGWRWTKAETRAAVIGFALDRLRDDVVRLCHQRHGDSQR